MIDKERSMIATGGEQSLNSKMVVMASRPSLIEWTWIWMTAETTGKAIGGMKPETEISGGREMIVVSTVIICILVLAVVDSDERLKTSAKCSEKTVIGTNRLLFDCLATAEC